MAGLHCLLDYFDKPLANLLKIHFVTQHLPKAGQGLLGIVAPAVKTAVNEILKALAQGIKQSCDDQRREDDCNWRLDPPGDHLKNLLQHPLARIQ